MIKYIVAMTYSCNRKRTEIKTTCEILILKLISDARTYRSSEERTRVDDILHELQGKNTFCLPLFIASVRLSENTLMFVQMFQAFMFYNSCLL